jgi:predicted aspartyl protease
MKSLKFALLPLVFLTLSCNFFKIVKNSGDEKINAVAYKNQVPFLCPDNKRIQVTAFFEKENKTRTLLFDSHAPVCLSNLANNAAFKLVAKSALKNKTPTGATTDRIAYLTDGVTFGNLKFDHVLVNEVPDRGDRGIYKDDGIFGKNLMKNSVWKIDFEHKILTMASSIDSIDNVKDAKKLTTNMTFSGHFTVETLFDNNVKKTLEVDLGYGGYITVPKKVFDQIDPNHKATVKEGTTTTIAGTEKTTMYRLEDATVKMGDNNFKGTLSSSDISKPKLLGLVFFSKFKFVIFDYLNKVLYVSNEQLPEK